MPASRIWYDASNLVARTPLSLDVPPTISALHFPDSSFQPIPQKFPSNLYPSEEKYIYIYKRLRRQRKTYFTPHTSSISSFHLSIIHQGRRSQSLAISFPLFSFPAKSSLSARAHTHTHACTHARTHARIHTRRRGGHKSSSVRRIINSWTRIGVSSRMPRETRRPPG